eukprot:5425419-Pyramimonas_sp.AAC.1
MERAAAGTIQRLAVDREQLRIRSEGQQSELDRLRAELAATKGELAAASKESQSLRGTVGAHTCER